MFICISLVRLSRLQSHLPKNAPGPLLLPQEHQNLMHTCCIIYVHTAQINKVSPRFLFFSPCFLCFSILGQCLKGVPSMLSLFLYSRSLLFYFLEGKLWKLPKPWQPAVVVQMQRELCFSCAVLGVGDTWLDCFSPHSVKALVKVEPSTYASRHFTSQVVDLSNLFIAPLYLQTMTSSQNSQSASYEYCCITCMY